MAESLFSPTNSKCDVFIISGFLGAGKTTLLKRILSWEKDLSGTVVLVNEFGEVGIDGAMLKDAGSDVVELTGGCICCSLKTDLGLTLKSIRQRFNPSQLFIETTGVADPSMVIDVFVDPELKDHMKIVKVVTVLDIELWEARECFGPVFFNQLQQADLILLNKIDFLEEHKISQCLNEIHRSMPHARVIPTIHCAVDPEIVMDGRAMGPKLVNYADLRHNQDDHEAPYGSPHTVSFTFRTNDLINETCFKTFTEKLPWELFRMKGPVRFPDRTIMVNSAGGRNEWTAWRDADETCLVFIGWNVEAKDILKSIEKCVVPRD